MPLDPQTHIWADSRHILSDTAKFGEIPSQKKKKWPQRKFMDWTSSKLYIDSNDLKI